jgi:cell division protein FtsA
LGILVEESILDIEKLSDQFIKDIFLMVQTPESISIKISVLKKNDGKKILKKDITYLIQDAKQQILNSNSELSIIHIIAENYKLNYNNCEFLPLDLNCENFSIDIEFICFPKILLGKFEKLFFNHQISINQFICTNYAKRFHFKNEAQNICELGKDIVSGINKQEVVSVPKILEKKGLFEKLFHFFE